MYKTKDIKAMKFDCMYDGTEYMDVKSLGWNDLIRFLNECEYMFGKKWEPLFLSNKVDEPNLFHMVMTFKKHNYIVCLSGEIWRDFHDNLIGSSSLLANALASNYVEKQKKKQLKWLEERGKLIDKVTIK